MADSSLQVCFFGLTAFVGGRPAKDLQDRLRGHAKAFDGLLSLIPAKMYYGEDTSVSFIKFQRIVGYCENWRPHLI